MLPALTDHVFLSWLPARIVFCGGEPSLTPNLTILLEQLCAHLFHNCNLEWFLAAKGEQRAPMVLQEMLTPLLAERIESLVSQKHAKWA